MTITAKDHSPPDKPKDGDLVWEYICPFQHSRDERLLCRILFAERYAPGQVPFPLNEGRVPSP